MGRQVIGSLFCPAFPSFRISCWGIASFLLHMAIAYHIEKTEVHRRGWGQLKDN